MKSFVILFFAVAVGFAPLPCATAGSIKEEAYARLDAIREQKRSQLFQYLGRIVEKANSISSDELMLEFFRIKRKYYGLKKAQPPPAELAHLIDRLKKEVRARYLQAYLMFYDILFVDKNGDVFHTIRRQEDYHKNLFEGELKKTSLARQLKNHPSDRFVDYEYYSVSGEPSAFFVEPVVEDGSFLGWFVLQCGINRINSMFTQEKGLGTTGEVFLVNKHQYMLTQSPLLKEPSILNLHLSRKNIEAKFKERSGHMLVTDYRGFRALSSFEVCAIGNSEWLLIAKIDEAEVITEQYWKHRKKLHKALSSNLRKAPPRPPEPMRIESNVVEVDMDEFRKVDSNELICTYGVSTCTCIIVTFPKRFAYMGHISTMDIVYGGTSTDLIEHIFKRIKTFDIYEYERRRLMITVIANHLESIVNVIARLVEEGVLLSQIKFLSVDSEFGNVVHDYLTGETLVEWHLEKENGRKLRQGVGSVTPVGEIVKDLIGYR